MINQDLHILYEEQWNKKANFRVKYKFYTREEGGRKTPPFQGIKGNFWYEHENHTKKGIFSIWAEFEDEQGNVIISKSKPVTQEGTAKMWIAISSSFLYHTERIKTGTIGYFMEGLKKTAFCKVIEIINFEE
ncbi:hypothetical protein WAF17_04965 [Bernardetia sp. ABR2-2B]|uniref:hypothetical protein n=1 Tax=Bernardetia sp. ABR2-2B TaxID=3127472 RepID=UPI0030D57788